MADRLTCITSCTVYTPELVIPEAAVVVEAGRIRAVGTQAELEPLPDADLVEAHDRLLVPGFIDLQINGGFGHDFTDDPASIAEVARGLPRFGVSAFLPTLVSAPLEDLRHAQQSFAANEPELFVGGSFPIGLHLEGPFLNPEETGAHDPAYFRQPSADDIAEWRPQAGIRMVTLAPELPGAFPVIRELVRRGILVGAGHSRASFEESQAGVEAGIRYATHLFNAMRALDHHEPGIVGGLLADERVTIGLIADGLHVHPSLVGLLGRALAPSRLSLVSDAMAGLGIGSGDYLLGGVEVGVLDGAARVKDGRLAGSVLSLDEGVRRFSWFSGCSLETVLPSVTTVPATLLGLGGQKGRIAPGFDADLVLLDDALSVVATMVGGKWVYDRNEL